MAAWLIGSDNRRIKSHTTSNLGPFIRRSAERREKKPSGTLAESALEILLLDTKINYSFDRWICGGKLLLK